VAHGDETAFTLIYQFYSDTIYHTALVYIKDEVEAREIVQQVFVRFWEYRAQLAAVNSLHNYFFIATRNRVFDHIDQLARARKALSELGKEMTATEDSSAKHIQHLLNTAIQQLPPQQKEVYQLAEEEALSYEEIAGRRQLKKNTVKKHLELARRYVRGYVRHFLHLFF
jgi:RNA polymerase sigma factor (sigma-70 family)